MHYFIFDYARDNDFVDSFLISASLSHKQNIKTKDWFYWKFQDNPYGETILACAVEENQIVGCVGYSPQPFYYKGQKITGALAFENFVHPEHQRKGIFKSLIKLAEDEARKRRIEILFVFPNSNSLPGYDKMGWPRLNPPEYWIKGKNLLTIPMAVNNLSQPFSTRPSNYANLLLPMNFCEGSSDQLKSVITKDYLKWRFFSFPVSEYFTLDAKSYYAVIRIGNRGTLKEAQILLLSSKEDCKIKISCFLRDLKRELEYDIISFPISRNNPIRNSLIRNLFIKVPNKANISYKILNEENVQDSHVQALVLSGINYHTY